MENYTSEINCMNSLYKNSGGDVMSVNYGLGECSQKYTGNISSENLYNNLIKSVSRGNHMGNYGNLK
jgi:hypothetical protein